MKKSTINIILLLVVIPGYIIARLLFSQINIYLSPSGNDDNSGNRFNKVKTIYGALSVATAKRQDGKNRDIVIYIDEGRYELSGTIEIDENLATANAGSGRLGLIARKGADVRFSGGRIIPASLIEDDNTGLKKIDLKRLEIEIAEPRAVGFSRPYGEAWTELFIDGQPSHLARWPDSSSVQTGEIIDRGSVPRDDDYSGRGATFRYSVEQPSLWSGPTDIWISGYFMHGYAEDAVRLAHIDTVNMLFITSQPTLYGFGSGKPWQKWYAFNIKEEVNMQNEYYLDKEGYILFPGADSTSVIEVSVLGDPMMTIENISNVTVEGIVFESSRGIGVYMENSTDCILTSCTFRNLGSVAVSIGRGIQPFKKLKHEGEGVASSRILGSLSQHIYSNTIFDRKAGYNNGLINCHIYNTGAGGVHLGGGNRVTLERAGNFVVNCTIHDYNRIEKSYRAGIDISGVGNRISYCEIFDAPSMAILLHGNEHLIAFNDIHDVCLDVDDQGAIYYGRDPSERGIKIHYNYFHELGNEHRTTAVYHDDGACGADVFGNVFYRAGTIPVLIGGGSDNRYKNNMFIDCPLGIHVDNRFQNWSDSSLEKDGIIDQRLKAVNYSQAPYSEYYPALANYWTEDPSLPKRNIVSNNLFCNVDQIFRGNEEWLVTEENFTTNTDPGFTNPGVDFSLKKESQVFKELSGFKNIPFESIGPQKLKRSSFTFLDRLK